MSLAEHLTELRARLVKCTLAVLVLGGVSLVFARPIFGLLMKPVLAALPPDARSLIYTSGIEEMNVLMKVGVYCGIFLTTPVILWQIWGFVSPGLYPEERRYASPFVVFGSLAFMLGAAFCYFAVLPSMFQFLLNEEEAAAVEDRHGDGPACARRTRCASCGWGMRSAPGSWRRRPARRCGGRGRRASWRSPRWCPPRAWSWRRAWRALGELLDATAEGFGVPSRLVLRQAVEKRVVAVEAFGRKDYAVAVRGDG